MSVEIASLVSALGGQVVGKIRLQKIVYLLDKLGLDSGFSYSYHHYGPFSAELSDATDFERFFGALDEEQRNRVSDGVPYAIFKTTKEVKDIERIGGLTVSEISGYADIIEKYSATELELAATAYWLAKEEEVTDWRGELKKRKGVKTEGGRTEKAIRLLEELNIGIS